MKFEIRDSGSEGESMDIMQAMHSRLSVRAFRAEPVPLDVLESIMQAALRAPSWENTQPWEFAVVGGKAMEELKEAVLAMRMAGEKPRPDLPLPRLQGPYLERARENSRRLLEELGMSRNDPEGLRNWRRHMSQFFDAPNAAVLHLDSALSQWSLLDAGLALQNLMLAACHYGVGTCAVAAGVIYPDLLRSLLGIPESHHIVLGVALGYPDLSSPAARFRASREPLDRTVTWHGFGP